MTLKLISNPLTYDERIQARIDGFAREIMYGQGDMDYIDQIMRIIYEYMTEYENGDIDMAAVKLKEAIFYVDCFKVD